MHELGFVLCPPINKIVVIPSNHTHIKREKLILGGVAPLNQREFKVNFRSHYIMVNYVKYIFVQKSYISIQLCYS